LIGMPGVGKSTAGRQIAKRTARGLMDSDAEIESRIGGSIRSFFEREGEARFRDIEADVINELTQAGPIVIATGGGVVLRAENRARLHERCDVVYLRSTPEELFRRLRHDTQRPLLQVPDPLGRLRELHQQRDPLYRETAHVVINTGRPTVHALADMILAQWRLVGGPCLSGDAADESSAAH
jgi:shikimate kinase